MKKQKLFLFLFFLLSLLLFSDLQGQCAMCKASAESSLKSGNGGIAYGINNGIIYLMGIPYILLFTFCIVFRKDIAVVYHRWRKTSPEALSSSLKEYRFLFVFFAVLSVLFLIFAYIQLK